MRIFIPSEITKDDAEVFVEHFDGERGEGFVVCSCYGGLEIEYVWDKGENVRLRLGLWCVEVVV